MVQFLPLDVTDEDSVGLVLSHIDNAIQYGEAEVRMATLTTVSDRKSLTSSLFVLQEPKEPKDMDHGDFEDSM